MKRSKNKNKRPLRIVSNIISKSTSRSKWKGHFSKTFIDLYTYRTILLRSYKRLYFGTRNEKGIQSFIMLNYLSKKFLNYLTEVKSRASVILPSYLGRFIRISTGRKFSVLRITHNHIGFRFGEFNLTTRRGSAIHRNNKNSKKNKNKSKK